MTDVAQLWAEPPYVVVSVATTGLYAGSALLGVAGILVLPPGLGSESPRLGGPNTGRFFGLVRQAPHDVSSMSAWHARKVHRISVESSLSAPTAEQTAARFGAWVQGVERLLRMGGVLKSDERLPAWRAFGMDFALRFLDEAPWRLQMPPPGSCIRREFVDVQKAANLGESTKNKKGRKKQSLKAAMGQLGLRPPAALGRPQFNCYAAAQVAVALETMPHQPPPPPTADLDDFMLETTP